MADYVWSDWEFLFLGITQNTAKPSRGQFDSEHVLIRSAQYSIPNLATRTPVLRICLLKLTEPFFGRPSLVVF